MKQEKTYFLNFTRLLGFVLLLPLLSVLLLKSLRIQSAYPLLSPETYLSLVYSDIFFYLSLLALALFFITILRNSKLRTIIILVLQLSIAFFMVIEIVEHNYFLKTGSHLTSSLLNYSITNFRQVTVVMSSESSSKSLFILILVPLLSICIPWIIVLLKLEFLNNKYNAQNKKLFSFIPLVCMILLLVSATSYSTKFLNTNISRNTIVNLAFDYFESFNTDLDSNTSYIYPDIAELKNISLAKKKNLVIIVLESTRADATSVYDEKLKTTPNLQRFARHSLVAENAFSIIPHTSKCLVAIHCGIEPNVSMPISGAEKDGIPAKCLPRLLNEKGYKTVFFQTPRKWFENRKGLVKNLGYKEFYPGDVLPKGNYEKINYFGNEDGVLLKPTLKWLKNHLKSHPEQPFMATILTNGSHHPYGLPSHRRITKYIKDSLHNKYLNTVNLVDKFLGKLLHQFKELGLMQNTVFVILGDHGEGFGEHGIYGHSFVTHTEGIKIPLIIHDGSRFQNGMKLKRIVQQHDLLPTITTLLGYQIINNNYTGHSLLTEKVENRVFYSSCWHDRECLSRIDDKLKIMYFFKKSGNKAYSMLDDFKEKKNIISKISNSKKLIKDALNWYKNNRAYYKNYTNDLKQKYVSKNVLLQKTKL